MNLEDWSAASVPPVWDVPPVWGVSTTGCVVLRVWDVSFMSVGQDLKMALAHQHRMYYRLPVWVAGADPARKFRLGRFQ